MIKLLTLNDMDAFIDKYFTVDDKETLLHSNIYVIEDNYVIVSEGYQIISYKVSTQENMVQLIDYLKTQYDSLVIYEEDNKDTLLELGFKEIEGEFVWEEN